MFSQSPYDSSSCSYISSNLRLFCLEPSSKSTNFASASIAHDGFVAWIACSSNFIGFIFSSSFCTLLPIFWIYRHTRSGKTHFQAIWVIAKLSRSCFVNEFFPDINAAPACETLLDSFKRLTLRVTLALFQILL